MLVIWIQLYSTAQHKTRFSLLLVIGVYGNFEIVLLGLCVAWCSTLPPFHEANPLYPNLAIENAGEIGVPGSGDEHYLGDVTFLLHLCGTYLVLSREHAHLLSVVHQVEPCFVDVNRLETSVKHFAIRNDLSRMKSTRFFSWEKERLEVTHRRTLVAPMAISHRRNVGVPASRSTLADLAER